MEARAEWIASGAGSSRWLRRRTRTSGQRARSRRGCCARSSEGAPAVRRRRRIRAGGGSGVAPAAESAGHSQLRGGRVTATSALEQGALRIHTSLPVKTRSWVPSLWTKDSRGQHEFHRWTETTFQIRDSFCMKSGNWDSLFHEPTYAYATGTRVLQVNPCLYRD